MNQFFSFLYRGLFEDMFGHDLAMYLDGQIVFQQQGNMFVATALTLMCISFTVSIIYYYVVDNPKFANIQGWLMFLDICIVVNTFVGWIWVKDLGLGSGLGFGIVNGLLSIPAFMLFSLFCKTWSHNSFSKWK